MADDEQLGQDDIEALLSAAKDAKNDDAVEEPAASPDDQTPEEPAGLGQDDVEALLNAGRSALPSESAAPAPAADSEVGLDQSEIEALLGGGSPPPKASPAPPASSAPPAAAPSQPAGAGSFTDVDLLLNQAEQALASIDRPADSLPPGMKPFEFEDFSGSPPSTEVATLDLVRDVELDLKIELGRTHMHLEEVLKLRKGSVVPLDKLAGDPVDIYVNGRLIARGEVLVLNDNFCVRVAELIVGEQVEVA